MNILYDKKIERTDVYTFKINSGGELGITHYGLQGNTGYIFITFVNGKFKEVKFDFGHKTYTREDWYVLKEVAEKIKELEESYVK